MPPSPTGSDSARSGVMSQAHRLSANRGRGAVGVIAPALVLAALIIASTMAIAARAAIVRVAPAAASLYALAGLPVNLRGLSIAGVHATLRQDPQGQGELLVTGEIANLRDRETPVPALSVALRAQDG